MSPSPRLFPYGTLRISVLWAMVRHHWFIRVRWLITLATILFLAVEAVQDPGFNRPWQLLLCIVALALVNIVWTAIGSAVLRNEPDENAISPSAIRNVTLFANAQMTVDLLLLTVILRYSGGIENPMSVFYLFHLMISVLLLTPFNAAVQGCWALVLYSALGVGECVGLIQPHYPFLASTQDSLLHTDWTYVLCGIGVLAAGVVGTLYFTYHISYRLDAQERELQEANTNLMRSQTAIKDLQARRSRFMLTAAHQLKGPLAGIETLAGLVRDGVVSADGLQNVVDRIIARCRQAIAQVTELLTLARVQEAPPSKHQHASTSIDECVAKVAEQFMAQAQAKDIELRVESTISGGDCAAIEQRDLEDCVANLIDNAIKYTPQGGLVTVRTSANELTLSVSVQDNGMGIAKGAEDDLFDPFRRGDLALAAGIPGSGLGLAIVREIVEQAHGHIDVHSVVGKGSEFTLRFPKCDAPRPTVRGTRTTKLRIPPSPTDETQEVERGPLE
ncbi:MAG: HAMP domain-containing histidine kinase [Phycisphaerales bacterium]|nr:MAG: HAMP domain-containing histidine kinase [Phycisphaerales bacterium]